MRLGAAGLRVRRDRGAVVRGHLPTNSLKIGLLTVALPDEQVRELMAAGQGAELTVDLEEQTVGRTGSTSTPSTGWLLEGLDDIGLTLHHEAEIAAFEAGHPPPIATTAL